MTILTRLLNLPGNKDRTLLAVSRTFLRYNRYAEAKLAAEKIISLSPAFSEGHMALANVFDKLGETDSAIRKANDAITLQGDNHIFHSRLGNMLYKAGRHATYGLVNVFKPRQILATEPFKVLLPKLRENLDNWGYPAPVGLVAGYDANLDAALRGQSFNMGSDIPKGRLLLRPERLNINHIWSSVKSGSMRNQRKPSNDFP